MKKITFCEKCGYKVDDSKFCPECGAKINNEVKKMNKTRKILLVILAITIIAGVLMVSTTQSNYNVEKMLLSNEKGSAWVNTTNNFKSINNGYMEKHNDEQFTIVKAFDLNNQDDIQSLKNITEIANKGKKYTDGSVVYYTVDYKTLDNQMNAWGITTLVLKNKEVNIGFMYDNDTNICVVVISNNFKHVEKLLKTVDFEVGGDFHKGTQDLTRMYISTSTSNQQKSGNTANTNNNQQKAVTTTTNNKDISSRSYADMARDADAHENKEKANELNNNIVGHGENGGAYYSDGSYYPPEI